MLFIRFSEMVDFSSGKKCLAIYWTVRMNGFMEFLITFFYTIIILINAGAVLLLSEDTFSVV